MSLYSIIDSYSGMSYQKHEVLITKAVESTPSWLPPPRDCKKKKCLMTDVKADF